MDAPHLESLIGDLKKSTSKLEQLRILTRAWRVLRTLDSRQRIELATHLGIEEGLPLLESLVSPGGLSTATLARAVSQAERADPKALKEILRGLKAPGHRLEALRKGVALVEATLDEIDPTAPASTAKPKPLPPPPLAAADPREESAPPPIPLTPEPPPAAISAAEPRRPRSDARPEAASGVPAAAPAVEVKPQAPPKPVDPAPKPALEKPPEPPPSAMDARWESLTEPSRPAPEPAPAQEALAAKSLMARFRELNRVLGADSPPTERLETLLAGFPQGWPRRRALTTLIRSGAVEELGALLDQIARLDRPQDEFWCLSALVHSRPLSRSELQETMSRARTRRGRRLLHRHLGALDLAARG